MSPHEPQLAWFFWSLILLVVWLIIYLLLDYREQRKRMLVVSLWTSLLGITEKFFVPAYWNPPSLYDLAHRTGFDIESFIFSFAIGGIAVLLYDKIFHSGYFEIKNRYSSKHRFHFLAILSAPIIFILLELLTPLNSIYSSEIALVLGGLATWYCRPDLKKKMLVSAFLFLILYFLYFRTLIILYPGYVQQVWNLKALSGILIFGIPLEEYLFALAFGFLWSSIYEHLRWHAVEHA